MSVSVINVLAVLAVFFVPQHQGEETQRISANQFPMPLVNTPDVMKQNGRKPNTWIHKVDIIKWDHRDNGNSRSTDKHNRDHQRRKKKQRKMGGSILEANRKSNNLVNVSVSFPRSLHDSHSFDANAAVDSTRPRGIMYLQKYGEPQERNITVPISNISPVLRYYDAIPTTGHLPKRRFDGGYAHRRTQSSKNRLRKKKKQHKKTKIIPAHSRIRFPGKHLRTLIRSENRTSWPRRIEYMRHENYPPGLQEKKPGNINKFFLVSPIFSFKMSDRRGSSFQPYRSSQKSTVLDPLFLRRHDPPENFHRTIPIYQPVCLSRMFFSNLARDDMLTKSSGLQVPIGPLMNLLFRNQKMSLGKWYTDFRQTFRYPPASSEREVEDSRILPKYWEVTPNDPEKPSSGVPEPIQTSVTQYTPAEIHDTSFQTSTSYDKTTENPEQFGDKRTSNETIIMEYDGQEKVTHLSEKPVTSMNNFRTSSNYVDHASDSTNSAPGSNAELKSNGSFYSRNDVPPLQELVITLAEEETTKENQKESFPSSAILTSTEPVVSNDNAQSMIQ